MYNLSKVNAGSYTLVVSYIGYDTTEVNINLEKEKFFLKILKLKKQL